MKNNNEDLKNFENTKKKENKFFTIKRNHSNERFGLDSDSQHSSIASITEYKLVNLYEENKGLKKMITNQNQDGVIKKVKQIIRLD